MRICYVDESGDTGTLPVGASNVQPALVVIGLLIEQRRVEQFTREFMQLKRKFYPGLSKPHALALDWLLIEVKGSELRRDAVSVRRKESRHAIGFIDHFLKLLQDCHVQIVGRVWIKALGALIRHVSIYTSSIQAICADFQHYLNASADSGIVLADSRSPAQNVGVSHSIFTQKYQMSRDAYPRLLEMPVFGHSDNHALLQAADLVSSALVYPMAMTAYCVGTIANLHARPEYAVIQARYGSTLRAMQFCYPLADRAAGGIVVADGLSQRSGSLLFG